MHPWTTGAVHPATPRATKWRRWRANCSWRTWCVYHHRGLAAIPESGRAALVCPRVAAKIERNTPGAGPSGFRPEEGPFYLVCPCGIEARWYYRQSVEYPRDVPGARWRVAPWPGDE